MGARSVNDFESGSSSIVYRIDRDDRIVFVNDTWQAFAYANDGAAVAEEVVGSLLWDAVAGDEPRLLWRSLVDRVRAGVAVEVPYRCDAPGRRRELTMHCVPLPRQGVEFVSTVRSTRDRDPIALLAAQYGSGEPVRSCSWCLRIDVDGYVDLEVAIERLALLEHDRYAVSHTICPACDADLRQRLETPR